MRSNADAKLTRLVEKMKLNIVIGILGFVFNSHAGELLVITGNSYGYMSNRNELIEEAKKDALSKTTFANTKLRSPWRTTGGN